MPKKKFWVRVGMTGTVEVEVEAEQIDSLEQALELADAEIADKGLSELKVVSWDTAQVGMFEDAPTDRVWKDAVNFGVVGESVAGSSWKYYEIWSPELGVPKGEGGGLSGDINELSEAAESWANSPMCPVRDDGSADPIEVFVRRPMSGEEARFQLVYDFEGYWVVER